MIILYLEGLNLVVRLSFEGFFDGTWLFSKKFSLLKRFFQKCVFKFKLDLRKNIFQQRENDVGASCDSFTQALTNERPRMLQFKPMKALVVFNDSYDLRLQMRSYEINKSLISWEVSYDASKNILNKEIQEEKIVWKTSILLLRAQVIAIVLF